MGEQQPGHAAVVQYVELIADLPWSRTAAELTDAEGVPTRACSTMTEARALLDSEHFGLGKVKERIVEYLAVRRAMRLLHVPPHMWVCMTAL